MTCVTGSHPGTHRTTVTYISSIVYTKMDMHNTDSHGSMSIAVVSQESCRTLSSTATKNIQKIYNIINKIHILFIYFFLFQVNAETLLVQCLLGVGLQHR